MPPAGPPLVTTPPLPAQPFGRNLWTAALTGMTVAQASILACVLACTGCSRADTAAADAAVEPAAAQKTAVSQTTAAEQKPAADPSDRPAGSLEPPRDRRAADTTGPQTAAPSGTGRPSEESSAVVATLQLDSAEAEDAAPDDLMSLDPRRDGWITEHFNSLAGAQLGELAKRFADPSSLVAEQLAPLLAAGFACGRLRPDEAETTSVGEAFQVQRADEWDESLAHRGPQGLHAALRELLGPLVECRDVHAKFKVIRVEPHDEAVTTVQLVEVSGHTASAVIEQHSTWRIRWQWDGGDAVPRLQAITADGFEQTTFRSNGRPLFADCTRAVFANEPAILERQLLVGIDNWVRRIEAHHNVYQFGHNGLAVGDVNGDGLDDVYACQVGGLPNRLLLAREDGTVTDASGSAGVDYLDNTRAALLVDLDNDGDQDLALTLPHAILLLQNDGQGRFTPAVRIPGIDDAFSLSAADYDNDGDLDLYACVYYDPQDEAAELPIPTPLYDANNGGRNVLIENAGNWNFHDATQETGLDENNRRFSFAAVWEDYDNDGDQDLFVANDYGRNNLYRNDAGRFRDVTEAVGMNDGAFGMSAAAADYNRDGWIDFYKAKMFSSAGNRVTFQEQFMPAASEEHKHRFRHMARGNTLFENRAGRVRDTSVEAGVTMGRWSWGSVFADFNNDGWEDLLVTNGFITGAELDDL